MAYAELHAHSAYSFLEGTDLPHVLLEQAHNLSLAALGILDIDGMYSAVQTAQSAKKQGMRTVYGAELTIDETIPTRKKEALSLRAGRGLPSGSVSRGMRLPVLASSQEGYHRLCEAISSHNLSYPNEREVPWKLEELSTWQEGQWKVLTGTAHGPVRRALQAGGIQEAAWVLEALKDRFGKQNVFVESCLHPGDPPGLAKELARLAQLSSLPIVATGAVRCSAPNRQALADVMTASRLNLPLSKAQPHLPYFGAFLRDEKEMLIIHREHPQAVGAAAELAQECSFDLTLMKPELPRPPIPRGHTSDTWLRHLTYQGARFRYGSRESSPEAWQTIDRELEIIISLEFSGYFLIVKDIVDYCAKRNILAQGRGSAANSAVCYALGITAVDAVRHKLLFERFLSPERSEPPDIDIDIEAGRREEVIQYVYGNYGRERAAQVANTITYRPRSAVRAAGKALGYSEEVLKEWSKNLSRGRRGTGEVARIPPLVQKVAASLQKLPSHMGIHPGGVVLTRTPVAQICPIMWAAKEERTVLQWDKDDCADAGLVKFDLLGLGMLTALRHAFTQLGELQIVGTNGHELNLYNLPPEEKRVYDLLCAGESVGVFQVESRAQMNTLPRLQPREFYDLVIEVALIRPGPIQGKAVNPYLRRRGGYEEVTCHPLLQPILERTLGVPLFQEQLMRIAIVGAGFSAAEADELRRALGSKRHAERIEEIRPRLFAGMKQSGLPEDVQQQIYESLSGFAEFGFPESHAFSFAYLVYASAWLKVFYPEHFYVALLASQPMGFYTPASLLADARRHGLSYRGPSVLFSRQAAAVEERDFPGTLPTGHDPGAEFMDGRLMRIHPQWRIRLGLDSIRGLGEAAAEKIINARESAQFKSLEDFARRTNLSQKELELLAQADAFRELNISRRQALWAAAQVANPHEWQPFIPGTETWQTAPQLPPMSLVENVQADYSILGLSVGEHPMALLRKQLNPRKVVKLGELSGVEEERVVSIAGIVTHRQRPGTAGGVTFLSLEDETGLANVVCTRGLWRRYGTVALTSNALVVTGRLERKDGAQSVRAQKLQNLPLSVGTRSRDFC